jgi:sensor histidine kinase YesM
MASLLVVTYLTSFKQDIYDSILRFLQAFLFVSLTSFCNLALLRIFAIKNPFFGKVFKLKLYTTSYLSSVIIWLFVKILYSIFTGNRWEGEGPHIYRAYLLAVLAIWVINTVILIIQILVILQYRRSQSEIEYLELKSNASEMANLLLKQQIHPHFLFNSLNTIKSLYKINVQLGENYLVHLANFLRVSISNHTTNTTLLKNEIEFCMDYLKMQKIRFGDAINYSISISELSAQNYYLPFFSLQPLVENALKHNELTEEHPILIIIKEEMGYLIVSNNIQPKRFKDLSTGQGLSNLAERYRLLGEEKITIKSDGSFFTVGIKLLDK